MLMAVRELLAHKRCEVDVPSQTERAVYPLHIAAAAGHADIIKELIASGADKNAKGGCGGFTPLLYASHKDHRDAVRVLLDAGVDLNCQDDSGSTSLSHACRCDDPVVEIVAMLLEAGADTERQVFGHGNWTALHLAAGNNTTTDVVKLLLEEGAQEDALNNSKETPLHLAASRSVLDIVRLLLEYDANVDKQRADGRTPLHLAVANDLVDVVKILLEEARCDPNIPDKYRKTAIEIAVEQNELEIVKLLLDHDADGSMALLTAVSKKDGTADEFTKLLVEKGAGRDGKDRFGRTAWDVVLAPCVRGVLRPDYTDEISCTEPDMAFTYSTSEWFCDVCGKFIDGLWFRKSPTFH
jgi:ankyrin repeat protein